MLSKPLAGPESYRHMTNQPDFLLQPMPVRATTRHQRYGFTLLASLFALLSACTANRTDSTKEQRLTLNVGDIREVTMATRADTTYQLTATSDNQEVVDVSRKPPVVTTSSGTNSGSSGAAVFLIKGVTAGTARVVFSETQAGQGDNGKVKKTYVVTVTSK